MTEEAVIEPLRLTFTVDCDVEHAFETWTSRIDTWWPKTHSWTGEHDLRVMLEPRLGGRIFERTASGAEHEWGEVTRWEPPSRFAYLWHLRRDRADATDVEITFAGRNDGTTIVEIVHTGWERLGAEGQEWRDRNNAGWSGVLPSYVAACATS
jgi:hypothetical protein